MAKNGNLLSFFKRVPKHSQSSQGSHDLGLQDPSSQASVSIPAQPSSTPPLPSSPLPEQDEKSPRRIDAVIKGSDDEDDDSLSSDDDLPNLFAKPRTNAVPVRANRESNPCVTPKAKRTAISFHSSPLAFMPKHKFDMKALLNHAKTHDAAEASAQRMSNILSDRDAAAESAPAAKPAATLYETMMDVLSDAEGEDNEAERDKLLRAVKRTEASVDRKHWRFFDQELSDSCVPARAPFPKDAARGGWRFLADPKTRQHVFGDGLTYTIQTRRRDLPDEIVLWVLDEISYEKSESLRQEYCRLLGVCTQQVYKFFDGDRLDRLFRELGAREEALDSAAKISGVIEQTPPYSERNWSMLQSVLVLLSRTSNAMTLTSLTHAVSILLRLGIDTVVTENIAIRKDFSEATEKLVLAVPIKSWDKFCGEVCLSFYFAVNEASLWWHALAVLPAGRPRLVELRRRLALVCFFNDPGRGSQHPDDNLDIPAVSDRLEDDEFVVARKTDYYELAARASILGIALGDGCAPAPSDDPRVVAQFDEEVDRLCKKIKRVWSAIDTGGAAYVSRLEARTAWQTLEHQLPHVVRTRPPPKTGILDLPKDREDPFQPRQRKFMTKFFKKDLPVAQPV